MQTPAAEHDGQRGKLGYFLALSILLHLLLVLPYDQKVPTPQIPAPRQILATLDRPATQHFRSNSPATDRPTLPGSSPVQLPAPETGQITTTHADNANHLRSLLHAALDQYFIYPPFARRQGWEGRVDVLVRLEHDGRLNALRIVRSSGYAVLDDDALLTLKRIGALPQARTWLHGASHDFQMPILYRLTES